MIRTACLSLAALALLALPQAADAYWPYAPWGAGAYAYGYNFNQGLGYMPTPPYYSIYPPVYYSPHITARHYGASPYAWPAGFSPSASGVYRPVAAAQPMMVVNPYVAGAAPAAAASAEKVEATEIATPVPLSIENPHFASISR